MNARSYSSFSDGSNGDHCADAEAVALDLAADESAAAVELLGSILADPTSGTPAALIAGVDAALIPDDLRQIWWAILFLHRREKFTGDAASDRRRAGRLALPIMVRDGFYVAGGWNGWGPIWSAASIRRLCAMAGNAALVPLLAMKLVGIRRRRLELAAAMEVIDRITAPHCRRVEEVQRMLNRKAKRRESAWRMSA